MTGHIGNAQNGHVKIKQVRISGEGWTLLELYVPHGKGTKLVTLTLNPEETEAMGAKLTACFARLQDAKPNSVEVLHTLGEGSYRLTDEHHREGFDK